MKIELQRHTMGLLGVQFTTFIVCMFLIRQIHRFTSLLGWLLGDLVFVVPSKVQIGRRRLIRFPMSQEARDMTPPPWLMIMKDEAESIETKSSIRYKSYIATTRFFSLRAKYANGRALDLLPNFETGELLAQLFITSLCTVLTDTIIRGFVYPRAPASTIPLVLLVICVLVSVLTLVRFCRDSTVMGSSETSTMLLVSSLGLVLSLVCFVQVKKAPFPWMPLLLDHLSIEQGSRWMWASLLSLGTSFLCALGFFDGIRLAHGYHDALSTHWTLRSTTYHANVGTRMLSVQFLWPILAMVSVLEPVVLPDGYWKHLRSLCFLMMPLFRLAAITSHMNLFLTRTMRKAAQLARAQVMTLSDKVGHSFQSHANGTSDLVHAPSRTMIQQSFDGSVLMATQHVVSAVVLLVISLGYIHQTNLYIARPKEDVRGLLSDAWCFAVVAYGAILIVTASISTLLLRRTA